jgi:hypothetical protein
MSLPARRWPVAVLILLAVAPAAASATEPMVYAKGQLCSGSTSDTCGTIWRSKATGQNQVQLTFGQRFWTIWTENAPELALSPDGQTIAYGQEILSSSFHPIYVMDKDGRNHRQLGSLDGEDPEFGADGRTMFFTRRIHQLNGDSDIYKTDWTWDNPASVQIPVISMFGHQASPSLSANGARLAFQSNYSVSGVNHERLIYVANSDGTQIRRLTAPSNKTFSWAEEPSISPDGTKVAFTAAKPDRDDDGFDDNDDMEIWVINWDGTGLKRLTTNDVLDKNADWSPDGSHIVFERGAGTHMADGVPSVQRSIKRINPDGTGESTIAGSIGYTDVHPQYRQASTTIGYTEYLAHQYRPLFYFHSEEHWRPLDVDLFLGEGHQICDGSCSPITSTWDLRDHPSGRIDITGNDDEGEYHSPDPACQMDPLRECDVSGTAIYYDSSKVSTAGYRYFNYWLFYRFNDWGDYTDVVPNLEELDHEGDWENVAVGASPAGDTFDYVNFGQHGTHWNYLRENLACDEPAGEVSGTGNPCDASSLRVHAFPAEGSHATYPDLCGEGLTPEYCGQSITGRPEGPHDGEQAWGRNRDSLALRRFPSATPAGVSWVDGPRNFVDWPGRWGSAGPESGTTPQSPGLQSTFIAPWSAMCAPDNESSACASTRRRRVTLAEAASTCSSWFGESVRAVACRPAQLHSSIRRAALGRRANLRMQLVTGRSRSGRVTSAGAPGLAQLAGRPLRARDRLVVTGTLRGARLFVRARTRAKIVEVLLRAPRGARRLVVRVGHARGRAAADGAPLAITAAAPGGRTVRPDGQKVVSIRR